MPRIDKIKFFLFLLIFLHIAANFFVLKTDSSPLLGEQFNNFLKSGSIYNLVTGNEALSQGQNSRFFGLFDAVYPPLMYFVACVFFLVFGFNVFSALFSLSFFFALLIVYAYKSYALFMTKQDALFCTAFLSFVPGIYGFSRILHVDFVLCSLLSITVYYLFLSLEKDSLTLWVTSGVFAGLSFLSKQSAAIYLFPLGVYILLQLKKSKIKYIHVFYCAGTCFLTACFWYILNLSTDNSLPFWALCQKLDIATIIEFFQNYSVDMRLYLLGNIVFITGFLSMFFVLFFIRDKIKILFGCLALFPLLFFCCISGIYSVRYLVPFIFFLCFFIPYFLHLVFRNKYLCNIAKTILLLSLVVPFFINLKTRNYIDDDLILKDDKQGLVSPLVFKYNIAEFTKEISSKKMVNPKIATLFNTLDSGYFRYALWKNTDYKTVTDTQGLVDVFYGRDFIEYINRYDVLILKTDYDSFLLKQEDFPQEFITSMQSKIAALQESLTGVSFVEKVNIVLGEKEHTFLIYIVDKS